MTSSSPSSVLPEPSEHFGQKGITFAIAKPEDEPMIWRLLTNEFFPDEPVFRSLGFADDASLLINLSRRMVRSDLKKCYSGLSVMAKNAQGELLGIKYALV